MEVSNEKSSLLVNEHGCTSTNTSRASTSSITRVQCKVYKRRWYVLFAFTANAFIFNMSWNTWGPIQEPSKLAFGWTDFDLILLSSWAAISLITTSVPLTWLMDSKGLCFLFAIQIQDQFRYKVTTLISRFVLGLCSYPEFSFLRYDCVLV